MEIRKGLTSIDVLACKTQASDIHVRRKRGLNHRGLFSDAWVQHECARYQRPAMGYGSRKPRSPSPWPQIGGQLVWCHRNLQSKSRRRSPQGQNATKPVVVNPVRLRSRDTGRIGCPRLNTTQLFSGGGGGAFPVTEKRILASSGLALLPTRDVRFGMIRPTACSDLMSDLVTAKVGVTQSEPEHSSQTPDWKKLIVC